MTRSAAAHGIHEDEFKHGKDWYLASHPEMIAPNKDHAAWFDRLALTVDPAVVTVRMGSEKPHESAHAAKIQYVATALDIDSGVAVKVRTFTSSLPGWYAATWHAIRVFELAGWQYEIALVKRDASDAWTLDWQGPMSYYIETARPDPQFQNRSPNLPSLDPAT